MLRMLSVEYVTMRPSHDWARIVPASTTAPHEAAL
jgi:hypothetical protein